MGELGGMNLQYFLSVLGRLVLAILLGGVVGWQREAVDRPAGLRTHILVCVGSAVYMLVSASFAGYDPARIAAQVASGMGFLGAGTILRHGSIVRGLTTAASLWTVAAIGLAIGHGLHVIAVLATGIVILTLTVLSSFEKRVVSKRRYAILHLRAAAARARLPEIQQLLAGFGVEVHGVQLAEVAETGPAMGRPIAEGEEMQLRVRIPPGVKLDSITASLLAQQGVSGVDWE